MNIDKLMKKPLPEIPNDIQAALEKNDITVTSFDGKNEILKNKELQSEAGFKKLADGTYLVSMNCPMPGITPEMIAWWFWWHPQADDRYRVWFPGAHCSIGYAKKDGLYFESKLQPEFRDNTQYPVEKIGGIKMPLRIDFVTPEEFGFSESVMRDNDIPLIVCGHVGAFDGLIPHTEMAHIFRKTEDGLFMSSRFWLGRTMKNPILRKLIITEDMARGMAEHCAVEYRNLKEILPALYNEEK